MLKSKRYSPDLLRYTNIVPGSLRYRLIFRLARLLSKIRVLKPNTGFQAIVQDQLLLILTPLAGSSAITSEARYVVLKHGAHFKSLSKDKSVYILAKDDSERFLSFYNKKIRNPTNIAKCLLLAQCGNLTHQSSYEEFEHYLKTTDISDKDKHLYTLNEIMAFFNLRKPDVQFVNLAENPEKLRSMLGLRLDRSINSTEQVSLFQPPVKFDPDGQIRNDKKD